MEGLGNPEVPAATEYALKSGSGVSTQTARPQMSATSAAVVAKMSPAIFGS